MSKKKAAGSPGKGRKMCPSCGHAVSSPSPVCKCGHKFKFKAKASKKKSRSKIMGQGTGANGNLAKIQSALSLIESLGGTKGAKDAIELLKKLEKF